jgi:hypothetical protein
VAVRT